MAQDPQPEAAARTTGASVLRAGGWNVASLVVPQLYLVVTSIVAARFLGPTDMGRQSFIAFVQIALVVAVTGGLPFSLLRFISETVGRGEQAKVLGLLSWAWRLEIGAALVGGGVMVGAGVLGASPATAWLLAGLVCALAVLQTVPAAVLGGLQSWRGVSILGLVTGGLATVGIFGVLAAGGGIVGMFAVEVVIGAVNLVISGILARRLLRSLAPAPADDRELRRRVIRYAAVGTINTFLGFVVWRRAEFLFLKAYSSDEQIALYSIAFAAVFALNQLSQAVAGVISPAFATLLGAGRMDRIRSGYSRTLRLVLLLTLPLTAATVTLGPAALGLVYGDAYRDAGTLLVIMGALLPAISTGSVGRALLGGLGRQRVNLIITVVAASLNVALNFILIPRYDAVGAALANAVAQLTAALAYVVYCTHTVRPVRWEAVTLMRAAVASIGLGGVGFLVNAWLGGVAGVAAGTIAAGAAFVALAFVLRIVPAADAAWLENTLGSRLNGRLSRVCRRLAPARRPA